MRRHPRVGLSLALGHGLRWIDLTGLGGRQIEDFGTLTKLPPHEARMRGAVRPPLRTDTDEAAARRTLRAQIARLERELAALFVSVHPRRDFDWQVAAPGGPRLLGMGELEELRDRLAARVEETRRDLAGRTHTERRNAERIEQMLVAPERFKWVRISNEDIGEPGCKHWHSRPRLGLIGMLMNWWRVKISSGCP